MNGFLVEGSAMVAFFFDEAFLVQESVNCAVVMLDLQDGFDLDGALAGPLPELFDPHLLFVSEHPLSRFLRGCRLSLQIVSAQVAPQTRALTLQKMTVPGLIPKSRPVFLTAPPFFFSVLMISFGSRRIRIF